MRPSSPFLSPIRDPMSTGFRSRTAESISRIRLGSREETAWKSFSSRPSDAGAGLFTNPGLGPAPDPRGPWRPPGATPVKADIRPSAPAGPPFRFDGDLCRPAQDCSETYGGSVVLNRIVRLTTTEFREEQVAIVSPFRDGPRRQGIHTLSSVGDRTLVDGKRFSFSGRAMGRNFRDAIGGRWNKVLVR